MEQGSNVPISEYGQVSNSSLAAKIHDACPSTTSWKYRQVVLGKESTYVVHMHNDYLTPMGRVYKWQNLVGHYTRTIHNVLPGMIAPAEYTWQTIEFTAGSTEHTQTKTVEWSFVRGQTFQAFLQFCVGKPPTPSVKSAELSEHYNDKVSIDVNYDDLPKSPAVDLLQLMSWDIITFEMFVGQFVALTEFPAMNISIPVDTVTDSWAPLLFSRFARSSFFKNGSMKAAFLGYGTSRQRAYAIYEFTCEGSELDVHADPEISKLRQQGSSLYSGKLMVDVVNGDLVQGDMTEIIIATVTTGEGRSFPVIKRRFIQVECLDEDETKVITSPRTQVASQDVTDMVIVSSEIESRAASIAARLSRNLETLIVGMRTGFDGMDKETRSLAYKGFHVLVGQNMGELTSSLAHIAYLMDRIAQDSDTQAALAFKNVYPETKRRLKLFISYLQVAYGEASKLYEKDPIMLKSLESVIRKAQRVTMELLDTLDSLNPELIR